MEPFVIFLIIVITVLTTILAIAGIQVIMILRNVNHTLTKANQTIDLAEKFLLNLTNPLHDLRSLGEGVKTGMHVANHISTWVQEKRAEKTTPTNPEK
ncbi:hypothetical protein ACFL2V_13700 [Pseudomonadota bacterium]